MKLRPWVELLLPTLFVGLGWLVVSGATTAFIIWLDSEHEQVMAENVTSIRAAAEMQYALWQMQFPTRLSTGAGGVRSPVANTVPDEFLAALDRAQASWSTESERAAIDTLRERFRDYAALWTQARSGEFPIPDQTRLEAMATEIAARCKDLRLFNQDLIQQRQLSYRNWTRRILWTRLLIVLIGPPLGVWIGFRMATRIGRRIANIQVSLAGVSNELGTVQVSTTHDNSHFVAIEDQVREVTDRIHEVVRKLHDAQREARQNERLAAIGQLAAGVAHGLRNPLTAVKLLVQTVLAKADSQSLPAEQLTVVQDEILRMEQTIQSLLNFAKPPALHYSKVNIGDSIQRAVNLVQGRAAQDGIAIEYHPPERGLTVDGDAEQIHQVFVNLLLNGMDSVQSGGIMQIETQIESDAGEASGSSVRFCEVRFSDNGPGIPPELIDRIFDPFVTTKEQGTGLGLAISRRYIEEHGGRLTAGNRPEGGAMFILRLPRLETTDTSESNPIPANHPRQAAIV